MSQITHHGDPSREHNFWVYPKHQKIVDSRWDTHDPHDLCDNYTFLGTDSNGAGRYQCDGHQNSRYGASGGQYHGQITTGQKTYHGDPSREHNFWVYPKHHKLVDSRWDTHDPHDLCKDYTFLGADTNGAGRYQCNGHHNGAAGTQNQGNKTTGQKTYHGDSSREHNFWVYPKHHKLVDTRWDTHDPHTLCKDYTFLGTDTNGVGRYKCNGHLNSQSGSGGKQNKKDYKSVKVFNTALKGSDSFRYSYNSSFNSSAPSLCIIIRTYGPKISYFPILALALLHTGLDNIRIYVINTDNRTDIQQLKQTIKFINDLVFRMDYVTFLDLGEPPKENEFGYGMTDLALSYLYNQSTQSPSLCQYVVMTDGDNFYSKIFGSRILPHMKTGKDIIAWGFVSHHYKPHYKESIDDTKKTVPQIVDDGTGKCTPVELRLGYADLGSVAYRLAFLKEHNLYFRRSNGSYYSFSSDGYFVEQAAQRTSASVILKQTLFFHQ